MKDRPPSSYGAAVYIPPHHRLGSLNSSTNNHNATNKNNNGSKDSNNQNGLRDSAYYQRIVENGSDRQLDLSSQSHLGAYINLGAFYLAGIPVAATLAFWLQLRGIGLWIGVQSGAFTQTVMLAIVTSCINWEKLASKARKRLFQGSSSIEYGTI